MHMVGKNQEGDIRDRKDGLQYGCTYYKYEEHKCARRGGYVDMEQCQSEREEKKRRQYPSIWSRRLKELRERNNLSQADVAKVLHCSQVAYGMYELGKRKLPIERLIMLAEFYHVSLDSLTGLSRE